MYRLLYISTARTPFSPSELDELLRLSRRNNAAVGVTGLLVSGGRRFLQALEGEEAAVRKVYARIRKDPRHYAAVELSSGPIEQRAFAAWSMGAQAGGAASDSATISDAVATLIAPIQDRTLRAYFNGFAVMRAAA